MNMKPVSLSIFPCTQPNLNLEIKRRLNLNKFLWQAIFEIFQIWTKNARWKPIPPPFPYLKHLQKINPSFVTKLKLSKYKNNETRETFCEGLRWMCKFFSISSKHFIIEFAQGNSCQFGLASFSDSRILCFFQLSYNGNKLLVKLLKSLYQYILFCKWQRGLYLRNLWHYRSYWP